MENVLKSLPRGARGVVGARSATGLLFVHDGIPEVTQVVFVRKGMVEVQYLRTTITDAPRQEFGQLVENSIRRIESAEFLPHSGIRFPQKPVQQLPVFRVLSGSEGFGGGQPSSATRSIRLWLA